ncbi:MAG: hypothetical protein AAF919_09450 [Pseudomonadota bacterium]
MTPIWKLLLALPIVATVSGCIGAGGGGATSAEDIEATVDGVDLDGDGSVVQGGAEVGQVN